LRLWTLKIEQETQGFFVPEGAVIHLVDGRSGAGKTEYGIKVALGMGATLVSLDDVYPGWDGLDAGSWHVWQSLIIPISKGQPGRYRRWDWCTQKPADWITVPAHTTLVVEGCGTLRSDLGNVDAKKIWIDAPEEIRRHRALSRDGAMYLPHWDRWAGQEERFLSLHHGRESADIVVKSA
jgi:hypothetical protein